MSTEAATFCATLVDEWVRSGVTNAFIAPGSRSTPLALALAARSEIEIALFHDERAASFAAVGHGLATGRPGVILCTSGTAAAHFHAAVIEAGLSGVPLIVCTADRPPELWDVGAPQTINQSSLYGRAVRFYAEPGVPTARTVDHWRSLGSRLVNEALGSSGRPGPVHTNLSFADPLVDRPGPLPPGRADGGPWRVDARPASAPVGAGEIAAVAALLTAAQSGPVDGVIIAGRGTPNPVAVLELARRLGWPVLADHRSGCRVPGGAIRHFDALLRTDELAQRAPQVVLRFGETLSSKVLGQWLIRHRPTLITALEVGRRSDPEALARLVVAPTGLAEGLLDQLPDDLAPSTWADDWRRLDDRCAAIIGDLADRSAAHDGHDAALTEPGVIRSVLSSLPDGAALVVSSSMPVRDLEWYGDNRDGVVVLANRGANGIDGVVSTAIGVATSGLPTAVIVGDVAFCHDSTALVALARRPIDLTIVVIDNDGGGIFSFLPQAEELEPAVFEQLFGTPHGTDVAVLARAHGLPVHDWSDGAVRSDDGIVIDGVRVVVATTDRAANRRLHGDIGAAVASAVATDGTNAVADRS